MQFNTPMMVIRFENDKLSQFLFWAPRISRKIKVKDLFISEILKTYSFLKAVLK